MLCYDPLESQLGKRAIVNLVYGAPIASCNFLIGGAYALAPPPVLWRGTEPWSWAKGQSPHKTESF